MIREAIQGLWRAKTRCEATIALDWVERCLDEQPDAMSDAEVCGFLEVMNAKSRLLPADLN